MSDQADESMLLHKPEDGAQFRRSKQTYVKTPLFCNHSLLSAGHLSTMLRDKQPVTHGALHWEAEAPQTQEGLQTGLPS